ncbi:MAG: hypothetical protein WBN75_11890 [Verrucomicrobiia bacterium]|jgi:glutamyl-tRNA reductase
MAQAIRDLPFSILHHRFKHGTPHHHLYARQRAGASQQRPLLLIDIAVPRDIDPDVNFMENVYLYNIDDLQAIADDSLKLRREEVARCEKIIAEKVAALLTQQNIDYAK